LRYISERAERRQGSGLASRRSTFLINVKGGVKIAIKSVRVLGEGPRGIQTRGGWDDFSDALGPIGRHNVLGDSRGEVCRLGGPGRESKKDETSESGRSKGLKGKKWSSER